MWPFDKHSSTGTEPKTPKARSSFWLRTGFVPAVTLTLGVVLAVTPYTSFLNVEGMDGSLPALFALVAFTVGWYGVDLLIFRQVNALVEMSKQLGDGKLTKRAGPPYGRGELGRLARAFDEMAGALQKTTAQLAFQATHDPVTGVANSTFFRDQLKSTISETPHRPLAVLVIDLDHFNGINNAVGQDNGDLLLQNAALRLHSAIGERGIVGRLASDEFAILLPNANAESAMVSAQNILKAFHERFVLKELPLGVDISLGIAHYPEHAASADLLIRRAELAMRQAREEKTGYAVYAHGKDPYTPERLHLIRELRGGIKTSQLYLLYQPKIDFHARNVSGVEALIRWKHPVLGTVEPDKFIKLAEQTGLIRGLTFWVLDEAITSCALWHQKGLNLRMAVNISSRVLERDLPERISNLLQSHKLPGEFLELEITEEGIMKSPIRVRDILSRLRELGVRVSIDDFGTGFSSLSYLSKLAVDEVKIDKSFVINMAAEDSASVVVQAAINLAHDFGLKAVAEGVEDKETLLKVKALGCDYAQGYYISRPISGSELPRWLTVNRFWYTQLVMANSEVFNKSPSQKDTAVPNAD